jgi:hypothetical protein
MTLEAAIAKVPFKILLPKLPPEAGEPHFHYSPPKKKRPERVGVHYHSRTTNRFWFSLFAELDRETEDRLEWEDVEFAGRRFRLSDPQVDGALSILAFQQEGTWVQVVADFSRDELLKVASSFMAARP